MEGPELRSLPRTLLCCPVELRVGDKTIRLQQGFGNLSAKGLFLRTEGLPVNTVVHIKIAASPPLEAEGVVRFCTSAGIGIEFASHTEVERRRLEDLIAELVTKETFAA